MKERAMADTPMPRMDKPGRQRTAKLTEAIRRVKERLGPATETLSKVKNAPLNTKATKVMALAAALLKQIEKVQDNPSAVAALVEDFENDTAATRADLHQALNSDVTLSSVTTVLAEISNIGTLARGL